MKDAEDEAFDDLARKQGSWGGGFPAKRQMAADKFIAAEEHKVGERYGYVPKLHPSEWMNAQPAQEPVAWVDLLKEAQQIVKSKFLWKKFIDGTPLANDIAFWMVDFAQKYTNELLPVQPAQEPPSEWAGIKAILDEYGLQAIDFVADFKAALAQPAQEPVAWMSKENDCIFFDADKPNPMDYDFWTPLYTTPPKREWVGLTDEDRYEFAAAQYSWEELLIAAEAKLKEKNYE